MLLSGEQKIVIIFLSITITLSGVLVMCKIIQPMANKIQVAYIEDSNQPVHLHSLISLPWALHGLLSQWSNVSSGRKLKLWSDFGGVRIVTLSISPHEQTQ